MRHVVLSRDVLFKPEKLSTDFINVTSPDDNNEKREKGIVSIDNQNDLSLNKEKESESSTRELCKLQPMIIKKNENYAIDH